MSYARGGGGYAASYATHVSFVHGKMFFVPPFKISLSSNQGQLSHMIINS